MTNWHAWFAWYPVWVYDGMGGDVIGYVWLKKVERRRRVVCGLGYVFDVTYYRLPQ